MRRVQMLGLTMMTVFAFGVISVSTASAGLPTILPEKPTGTTGTSTTSTMSSLAGTKLTCVKSKVLFEFTKEGKLGPFHIHLEECTTKVAGITVKCNSTGDEAGIVLALGEFHLVYDKLGTGTALGVGILLLFEELKLECPKGGTTKIAVKGEELCLVTPVAKPVTSTEFYTVVCKSNEKGDQIEKYWNSAGTAEIAPLLLVSFNGGAFETAAEDGEAKLTATQTTEIMG